ncbi:hypothetical protein GEMRC1_006310 [Eukaryota sp. GEM-RC1]
MNVHNILTYRHIPPVVSSPLSDSIARARALLRSSISVSSHPSSSSNRLLPVVPKKRISTDALESSLSLTPRLPKEPNRNSNEMSVLLCNHNETFTFTEFSQHVQGYPLAIHRHQSSFYICPPQTDDTFSITPISSEHWILLLSYLNTQSLLIHNSTHFFSSLSKFLSSQHLDLPSPDFFSTTAILDLSVFTYSTGIDVPSHLEPVSVPAMMWTCLCDCVSDLSYKTFSAPSIEINFVESDVLAQKKHDLYCLLKKCTNVNIKLPEFLEIDLLCAPILSFMSFHGVYFNSEVVLGKHDEIKTKLAQLETKAHELAKRKFLLSSPQQCSDILFSHLSLSVDPSISSSIYNKTDVPSSCERVLSSIRDQHPIVDVILTHRELFKLNSTYIQGLTKDFDVTKKHATVHPIWSLTSTETGRISCSGPNLQNLPTMNSSIEHEVNIRSAIITPTGFVLMSLDFRHLELRCLGLLSQDIVLCNLLKTKHDVYHGIAKNFFGIKGDDVSDSHRTSAKRLCYAMIYGVGAQKLSEDLCITVSEAKSLARSFCQLICPNFQKFQKKVIASALSHEPPCVILPCKRTRTLPDLISSKPAHHKRAQRQCINTIVQGFASFLVKKVFILLCHELQPLLCKPIMHIHDELVFLVPENSIDNCISVTKDSVQRLLKNELVTFPVSVKVGGDFGSLE